MTKPATEERVAHTPQQMFVNCPTCGEPSESCQCTAFHGVLTAVAFNCLVVAGLSAMFLGIKFAYVWWSTRV